MVSDLKLIKKLGYIITQLKKAEIIHTGSWKGDIGKHLAIKRFKLRRTNLNKAKSEGFDAKDKKGRRVEIKTFGGTAPFPEFGGFSLKKKNFDYAILVELDQESLMPIKYYKVDHSTIIKYQTSDAEKKGKRFDLRQDKLKKLKQNGLIKEYQP